MLRQVDVDEFRQVGSAGSDTSSSFSTCDMMAPFSLTAGETSALTKCRATLLWIFCDGIDALEVSVQDQLLVCVHLEVAQQHLLGLAVDFQVQDRNRGKLLS